MQGWKDWLGAHERALIVGVVMMLLVIWGLTAFFPIEPDEMYLVKFFGRPLWLSVDAPGFAPFPMTKQRISRQRQEIELPTDPEKVKYDDTEELTPEEKRAIRFNFSMPEDAIYPYRDAAGKIKTDRTWKDLSEEEQEQIKKDPYNRRRLTGAVNFFITYEIPAEFGMVKLYVRHFGSQEKVAEERFKKFLDDIGVSAVEDTLSRVTAGYANGHSDILEEMFENTLRQMIGDVAGAKERPDKCLGVTISMVQMKPINFGKTIAMALAKAADADFEAERLAKIARGEGEAELERADYHARALKKVGDVIQDPAAAAAAVIDRDIQVAREVGQSGGEMINIVGGGNAIGEQVQTAAVTAQLLGKGLQGKTPTEKPPTEPSASTEASEPPKDEGKK